MPNLKNIEKKYVVVNQGVNYRRGFFSCVLQYLSVCHEFPDKIFYFKSCPESPYNENIEENFWDYFFISDPIFQTKQKFEEIEWTENNYLGYNKSLLRSKKYRKHEEMFKNDITETINNHLILRPEINKLILDFTQQFQNKKTLAIHCRQTDIYLHFEKLSIDCYFKEIDKCLSDYDQLFLCTDSKIIREKFIDKYENVLYYPSEILSSDAKLPAFKEKLKKTKKYSGKQMGLEILVEAIIGSQCDFLIRTISNVSYFMLWNNPRLKSVNLLIH